MTTPFPKTTIEGYPRIGANRELKRALEAFWKGTIDEDAFLSATHSLRVANYKHLVDLGLAEDYAIPADVALYDQVLESALTVGILGSGPDVSLEEEFALARGTAESPALEMTKWFDTNYHYIVPELGDAKAFSSRPDRVLRIVEEAREAGVRVRPYLVGPVTLLALAKQTDGAQTQPFAHLDAVVRNYVEVLAAAHDAGVEWFQLAEPALVSDFPHVSEKELAFYVREAYSVLLGAQDRPQLYVTTPYGAGEFAVETLAELEPEALQVDLSVGNLANQPDYLDRAATLTTANTQLVAGLIDGRNVWSADLRDLRNKLDKLPGAAVSTSVSLQHVPHTVEAETNLPVDIVSWFSFADEKVKEALALTRGPIEAADEFARADRAVASRRDSKRRHNDAVQQRLEGLLAGEVQRQPEFAQRVEQQKALNLPTLPTTTIGSFPQTPEIRKARANHRSGALTDADYDKALRTEIKEVIELQERLGLDVLVHGEAERNDMVQYFAELLDGFVVTENGWVQSYGSRCTRPPIIIGDVSRPAAMTVEYSAFAQSLSNKHVKGMLTGPVTILAWSFVRDDVPQKLSADQIAVALADEVRDLEEAGIDIIQIDEPALRELLPLRAKHRPEYLEWAIRAFRLVALDAKPTTQIHTHLCYSEFNQIIDAVAALDADVTSIEAARSRMELLEGLNDSFVSGIGPGVYDIHSPRVPSVAEVAELIRAALRHIPAKRLWVNPDCGLKTRGYAETEASLRNLVLARDTVLESTEEAEASAESFV